MRVGRVCLFPCNGIRRKEACVARLSGYYVDEELLPGKILILCLPALLRGVEEDILMVEKNPTLVIDGCEERCGSHALLLFGILPAAMIYVPEVAEEMALTPGNSRQTLDETGKGLSQAVARRAAQVAGGMLADKGYSFVRQQLRREKVALCRPMPDVPGALGYVRVDVGVYRPAAMPLFELGVRN